jgi:predicted dehydrogenase
LNGKNVEIEGGKDPLSNVGRLYEEFAKGPNKGVYADFDDAVIRHKVIDAIERSSREGKAVSYL